MESSSTNAAEMAVDTDPRQLTISGITWEAFQVAIDRARNLDLGKRTDYKTLTIEVDGLEACFGQSLPSASEVGNVASRLTGLIAALPSLKRLDLEGSASASENILKPFADALRTHMMHQHLPAVDLADATKHLPSTLNMLIVSPTFATVAPALVHLKALRISSYGADMDAFRQLIKERNTLRNLKTFEFSAFHPSSTLDIEDIEQIVFAFPWLSGLGFNGLFSVPHSMFYLPIIAKLPQLSKLNLSASLISPLVTHRCLPPGERHRFTLRSAVQAARLCLDYINTLRVVRFDPFTGLFPLPPIFRVSIKHDVARSGDYYIFEAAH
ncbi:hypothetical protein CB0940_07952 [Cercospora beticola]|uniref:F-box domain-containing protein n=1 Tax=Cercospora beticola TaxID=122368 RepID=A0A2G5HA42_CERBT|nr:hypothetical protein CB0940_07952 [Cercospora beticola]PIA89391.1 hypothetical protein CB0940_07952 [Cercospora beticola]WPB08509.1 hypothetical protein RHO25_013175 [Cercospora beticola]